MATVLIVGDTHAPCMRRGYVDFLKATADIWQPEYIVHIGDLIDNCAYSYHEKHPQLKNPKRERERALAQVKRLTDAFPVCDLLIGNHDALTQRQAVTAGLDPDVLIAFRDFWELPLGWNVHARYSTHQIEGVLYSHGDRGGGGMNAATVAAKAEFASCVIGHHHSNAGVTYHANQSGRVFGLSVGCGVDASSLAMDYGRRFTRKPILGCGIVVDGIRAFFEPWTLKGKRKR